MRRWAKALLLFELLLLTNSCHVFRYLSADGSPPKGGWAFERYYQPATPIRVYIEQFRYTNQLLPTVVAIHFLESEVGCHLFEITDRMSNATVFIRDHQQVDMLTGQFLDHYEYGKDVLADTGYDIDGDLIYIIRIFGQDTLEYQARTIAHELSHVLGSGHNNETGDLMQEYIPLDGNSVHLSTETIAVFRRLHCKN